MLEASSVGPLRSSSYSYARYLCLEGLGRVGMTAPSRQLGAIFKKVTREAASEAVSEERVKDDVRKLSSSSEGVLDEDVVMEICTSRSYQHLRAVFDQYARVSAITTRLQRWCYFVWRGEEGGMVMRNEWDKGK